MTVSNSIMDYDSHVRLLREVESMETSYQNQYLTTIGNVFDVGALEKIYHKRDSIATHDTGYFAHEPISRNFLLNNPPLLTNNPDKVNEALNIIFNAKRLNDNSIITMTDLYTHGTKLMNLIKKEYEL
jgi:hypothetical protein